MRLTVEPVTVPLRGPLEAGHGTVTGRDLLIVSLTAADGTVGYGEAAPLESYDGVSVSAVRAALELCRPAVRDSDGPLRGRHAVRDVLARCAEMTLLPQALAAIDLALWDLEGRRAREPVWKLLGARSASPVAVNWTIAAADRAGAAREAARARDEGFRTVKVKVAIGDDAGRLAAVRAAAGPSMAIRIDANGAWSMAEAEAALRLLAPVGLELCEEPVHGAEAIRALGAGTVVPLALDESAQDPAALRVTAALPGSEAARARPAADFMCLKISRCGGLAGTIDAARRARAAGYDVYLASTLDGPLGIAAALHAATVIRPDAASGLATLALFRGRLDPLAPREGAIAVPGEPGLGDELSRWY